MFLFRERDRKSGELLTRSVMNMWSAALSRGYVAFAAFLRQKIIYFSNFTPDVNEPSLYSRKQEETLI